MSFEDEVVWLVGASAGIGEALAHELAGQGARLILSARRAERLEKLRDDLRGRARDVQVLPFDQGDLDAAPDVARQARERAGPVDVLVLNAAIGQNGLALDTELELVERLMRVNFLGPVALAKAVVPAMVERGSGHVVVTSSTLGKFGIHRRSAYSASKHALHGYFDSLRSELRDTGVDVTLVCPGFVRTEIERRALNEAGEAYGENRTELKGMPADVFARKMIGVMARRELEATIGGRNERGAVWLKRLAPGLLHRALASEPMD
ncbi:MAG: SDR family oxidoreductase [Myxococcota bacterium]